MSAFVEQVAALIPGIEITPGNAFAWSPKHRHVTYREDKLSEDHGRLALIHEAAHALLRHQGYQSDLELLLMEVEAWEKARELARKLGHNVDEEHIQDCLDTYRDWLHQRSTCPRCGCGSLQSNKHTYNCHNCDNTWQVSSSRFCRPYRRSVTAS